MRPTLDQIKAWILEAGDIVKEGFGSVMQVRHKGPTDLVTEYDRRSEEFLLGKIQAAFPDHGIFAEESGTINPGHEIRWYIDPLDGTVNYAHGVPLYSVSIAYAENGEVLLGAVYDPEQAELFTAEKGKGAALNGQTLHCSKAEALVDALLITGFPYDMQRPDNNLNYFNAMAVEAQGVRRLGSAALDLCYVAAGRADGYWEDHLRPYDIAAGILIAREAEARVTRMDGSSKVFLDPSTGVVAANPRLHAVIMDVIKRVK